jgi:hypothetical protein
MTRARRIAVLMLTLTFTLGALSGMAIEEATGIDWFEFLDEEDDDAEEVRLMSGIQLSPEQDAKIDSILDRQEDQIEDYWESRMPEIEGILAQSYADIRVLLNPQQQSVFDRRVRDLDGRVPEEFR